LEDLSTQPVILTLVATHSYHFKGNISSPGIYRYLPIQKKIWRALWSILPYYRGL